MLEKLYILGLINFEETIPESVYIELIFLATVTGELLKSKVLMSESSFLHEKNNINRTMRYKCFIIDLEP